MMRGIKITALCVTAVAVLFASKGFAQTSTTIPTESPQLYKGVRPLGMGNAFIAMPGSDENAMYYNPAAINDNSKKVHGNFLFPSFDFTLSSIDLVKDVIDLSKDIDDASGTDEQIDVFKSFVDVNSGRFESVQLRMPIIQLWQKYFALGLVMDSRTTVSLRNRTFTNLELMSRNDAGLILGTAYSFLDEEQLQAGLAIKALGRFMFDRQITTSDILTTDEFIDILKSDADPTAAEDLKWPYGFGVGVDLGLKWKVPTFDVEKLDPVLEYLKPTVGFVYQDIGNTRFTGPPMVANTPQSVSLGFAVHPKLPDVIGGFESSVAMDFRDLNQSSTFIKKFNIGYEIRFPELAKFFNSAIRFGFNQGYIAAGFTMDLRYFKLEFATYGEEMGMYSRHKESRRIAANMALGF